jgi:hypothetical protein
MRVTPLPVFLLPFLLSTESFGYPAHSQHTVDVTDSSIHPRAGVGVPGSSAGIPIVMSGALDPPSKYVFRFTFYILFLAVASSIYDIIQVFAF